MEGITLLTARATFMCIRTWCSRKGLDHRRGPDRQVAAFSSSVYAFVGEFLARICFGELVAFYRSQQLMCAYRGDDGLDLVVQPDQHLKVDVLGNNKVQLRFLAYATKESRTHVVALASETTWVLLP